MSTASQERTLGSSSAHGRQWGELGGVRRSYVVDQRHKADDAVIGYWTTTGSTRRSTWFTTLSTS